MNTRGTKKILFVNRYYWPDESATSRMLSDLSAQLYEAGYEVHILTSRQLYTNAQAQLPPADTRHGVRIHRINTTQYGRSKLYGRALDYLSFYLSAFYWLLRKGGAYPTVVAKTDPPLLSVIMVMIASFRDICVVNWCQDLFPEVALAKSKGTFRRMLNFFLSDLRDLSLKKSNATVVISADMENYLKSRMPHLNTHVISNWADADKITERSTHDSATRAEWGIPAGTLVIGYSGNLGRAHDWQTMLAAARRLKDDPAYRFVVIGGGHGYEQLRSQPDLPDNIRLYPYAEPERLGDSLSAADIHWVSLKETQTPFIYPSKLYGITAAGRATLFVGDTQSELAKTLRENHFGQAVSTGDVDGFISTINYWREQPAMRIQAGKNARIWFEKNGTLTPVVQKWNHLLSQSTV